MFLCSKILNSPENRIIKSSVLDLTVERENLNQTLKLIILLIAVGLVISSALFADGVATNANATAQKNDLKNNLTDQINALIQQEIIVNETGYNQIKDSGWTKYYNTTNELTALGVSGNSTLSSQMNDLQNQVVALQAQLDAATQSENATGNTLIIAGSIGFLIVGLSVLIGYAAHKHMVTLISKSQKASV